MISQLSSGTPVNPTLSVVAPPGLQFFNDVKCVPLVYGNALIEGTLIDDMSAISPIVFPSRVNGVNYPAKGGAAIWQALCFGKIKLNSIITDSNLSLQSNGAPYDAANFNNGDPVSFQTEKPTILEKPTDATAYSLLPYVSALHGIAHYYFSTVDSVPWTDSNHTTLKKVRYDITRILQTGIFNPGGGLSDDIPWSQPEIDEYHTGSILIGNFEYVGPGTYFEYNTYLVGQEIVISLENAPGLANLPDDTPFVFLPLVSLRFPHPLLPNTVYYLNKQIRSISPSLIPSVLYSINTVPGGGVGTRVLFTENFTGDYPSSTVTTAAFISLPLNRTAGNNPAAVIFDILTNPFYGLALDSTIDVTPTTGVLSGGTLNRDINVQSFWRVMNFFYNSAAKPYGINCTFQEQTTAKDMIKKICEWTDCILTIDNNGKYYLTVNDATRLSTQGRMGGISLSSLQPTDANGVPLLVTDDFIDFKPTFRTFDDTINEFRAKFCSFADSYTNLEVFFRNEANVAETGLPRAKEYDLASFIFPEIVATRIQEIAKRESFPLITISTVCKIGMITALVNDICHIIHTEYGIDDLFKITKKSPSELETGSVAVEWVQCSELMFDLYGGAALNASPSVPSGTPPGQNVPGIIINLTFPMGSNISTVRSTVFTTDSLSVVSWGPGQENAGALVYTSDGTFASGGDYTVIGHNQIKLNPTKFANTIQANVLGLLNVDTQQGQ